jgi:hypothetical protein
LRKEKEAIKSKATQHCWIGLTEMKKRRREETREKKRNRRGGATGCIISVEQRSGLE